MVEGRKAFNHRGKCCKGPTRALRRYRMGSPITNWKMENIILENELLENYGKFRIILENMYEFLVGIKMYSHNQISCNLEVEKFALYERKPILEAPSSTSMIMRGNV